MKFFTIKLIYCCPSPWGQNASACDCDYVMTVKLYNRILRQLQAKRKIITILTTNIISLNVFRRAIKKFRFQELDYNFLLYL